MIREETVFGPIFSRRLGTSLGINLLPEKGKICNFDCIYCECGWNRDGRNDTVLPSAEKVKNDLERMLCLQKDKGVKIDSITFSGDGEPTLNPAFAPIIDITLSLRDRLYPEAQVSVLSNATRLDDPAVFAALRKVDNPILKLDAADNASVRVVNRPQGRYRVADVVAGMRRFEGDFILQTMFLRGPGFDSSAPEVLLPWMDVVRDLHPRKVMVYTLAREAPAQGLEPFTAEQMRTLVRPLLEEGFDIQIND